MATNSHSVGLVTTLNMVKMKLHVALLKFQ